MNKRELVLYEFLTGIDVNPVITTSGCIQCVQDAVYEHGEHLGFIFGDYPVGKFSPELRDLHIELHNSLLTGLV